MSLHPDDPSTPGSADRSGLAQVTLRAATDREFRLRLLADPRAAIRETLGIELPPRLRVNFIEKGEDVDLLVVLPDPVEDLASLPHDQLDVVLGGALRLWTAAA
jgi:hypothetical protein